jgi:hypothetical protein
VININESFDEEKKRNKEYQKSKSKEYFPRLKLLADDYVVKPQLKLNGHTVLIVGKKFCHWIDTFTRRKVAEMTIYESHFCKVTMNHVLIKHSTKNNSDGWTIISL